MSRYSDRAAELRAVHAPHYNCAQATFIPFAEAKGIDENTAYGITLNFGSGMNMAATCGAITGGLMVLGLYGIDDRSTVAEYYQKFRDNHEGFLDCRDLLRVSRERGLKRGPHCDGLVLEAVGIVEEILKEKGLLSE